MSVLSAGYEYNTLCLGDSSTNETLPSSNCGSAYIHQFYGSLTTNQATGVSFSYAQFDIGVTGFSNLFAAHLTFSQPVEASQISIINAVSVEELWFLVTR